MLHIVSWDSAICVNYNVKLAFFKDPGRLPEASAFMKSPRLNLPSSEKLCSTLELMPQHVMLPKYVVFFRSARAESGVCVAFI
jgi:hypothetical protein